MFCPYCGKQAPEGAAGCDSCGREFPDFSKLEAPPPAPPRPAPPAPPPPSGNPQVCSQCRREGPANLTTCPHCGGRMKPKGSGATSVVVIAVLGVGCLLGVAVLGILAAILVPNFVRARAQGQFTACKSNLKNVGTALEMYSTDFEGLYPESLDRVTPDYLRMIPTCPSAGRNTYSQSYEVHAEPDAYTVFCAGENHLAVGAGADHPQYNSNVGLVDRGH